MQALGRTAARTCTAAAGPPFVRRGAPAGLARPNADRSLVQRAADVDAAPAGIAAAPGLLTDASALQGPARIFAASLRAILDRYFASSPTPARVVQSLFEAPGGYGVAQLHHDHLAFRTFGVPGLGIESLGAALESFGYAKQDYSVFPGKKLLATWYAPPPLVPGGPPAYELLPRVFVSQIEVPKLSPEAQGVISRYTSPVGALGPAATWGAALTGELPWGPPAAADYEALMRESEYAAWVLANGYALNHTALSVHRLSPAVDGGLAAWNARLQAAGFDLNGEGGLVKASPDGLLLQSSTVADLGEVEFREEARRVPRAYIEFVERLPLLQHAHLAPGQLSEAHRRDGFEAGSADNIFASTTLAAARQG